MSGQTAFQDGPSSLGRSRCSPQTDVFKQFLYTGQISISVRLYVIPPVATSASDSESAGKDPGVLKQTEKESIES